MSGFARFAALGSRLLVLSWMLFGMAGLARAAMPDFLVDGAWLEDRLKAPKLVVLEVRYFPHRHATVGHVPGAVQVQRFKDLGDNDNQQDVLFGTLLMFLYSIGHGALLLAAGSSVGFAQWVARSRWAGHINGLFTRLAGALLVGYAFYLAAEMAGWLR